MRKQRKIEYQTVKSNELLINGYECSYCKNRHMNYFVSNENIWKCSRCKQPQISVGVSEQLKIIG